MNKSNAFSPASTPREVEDFQRAKLHHPRYTEAFTRTWSLATRGSGAKVVIVAGPTGVGKSTLGVSLMKTAQREAEQTCIDDPSIVPAVLVKAIPPHGRSFNWKEFYIRTLEQLREPLIDRKVWSTQQLSLLGPEIAGKTAADGLDTELLRRSLEQAFKRRHTRFLIVDEAHHMLLCHDQKQLVFQFETLKSLADMCDTTLVLLGTYKLLMIRDYSAQLIRRSQIVHFPCYAHHLIADRKAFKSVLAGFAGHLAVKMEPTLAIDVSYFFRKTAGCVGILRDLLRDALYEALEKGEGCISREIVDRVAQPNRAIKTIIEEAAEGSVALEDIDSAVVDALIQKSPKEIVVGRLRERGDVDIDFPAVPGRASRPAAKRVGPVGQRLPTRDRVGGVGRVNLP